MTAQPLTDGEQWSRAQLAQLRAARFAPRALAAFLAASERRARDERRTRPEVARRELRWTMVGAGAWVALAQLGVEPFRSRRRIGLGGWAATMLMLDWHLGMLETADGRPRNLGPADAATLVRAWLVPAVAHDPRPGLCLLGFTTDAVDGPLARATAPTRLGRDLEGLVDAVFAVAVLRGARRRDRLGRAATIGESVRLLAGIAYGTGVYLGRAAAPDARLLHAARALAPARAAGVLVAAAGGRRTGGAIVVATSMISVATTLVAFARARVAGRAPCAAPGASRAGPSAR